jgi:hypothetical protein
MDELRELHLAQSQCHNGGPSVMEGLSESYARASTGDLTGERVASAKTGPGGRHAMSSVADAAGACFATTTQKQLRTSQQLLFAL